MTAHIDRWTHGQRENLQIHALKIADSLKCVNSSKTGNRFFFFFTTILFPIEDIKK